VAASFTLLPAQSSPAKKERTIVIRMIDGNTGRPIASSNYLVRINHLETVHADWVKQNEDGTGKLILPQDAAVLAVSATYESTMQVYVNCDAVKEKPIAVDHWYEISEIVTSGVAAPNGCSKKKSDAGPGEFVFFVRKQNWREQMKDYSGASE
jgi:hypothetical protein